MVIGNFKNSCEHLEAYTAIVSKWPYNTNFRSYNNTYCYQCWAGFLATQRTSKKYF